MALDQVRRNEQAAWSEYDRKKCKRIRRIFYKKRRNEIQRNAGI
ncbi:hypothetical protein B4135_3360 [Caldibacillus debilis]|uniref:Uncharacterized protein n=1 Tax=Caldibacillus debilis TaxID=301148 RepID=A0A150LFP3_9BACI|nr:hypothetical protein B4135_3360 [Caldibacillus debilis]